MVVSPFWGLELQPLGTASRSFLHVLITVGEKEHLISNEMQVERWICGSLLKIAVITPMHFGEKKTSSGLLLFVDGEGPQTSVSVTLRSE